MEDSCDQVQPTNLRNPVTTTENPNSGRLRLDETSQTPVGSWEPAPKTNSRELLLLCQAVGVWNKWNKSRIDTNRERQSQELQLVETTQCEA